MTTAHTLAVPTTAGVSLADLGGRLNIAVERPPATAARHRSHYAIADTLPLPPAELLLETSVPRLRTHQERRGVEECEYVVDHLGRQLLNLHFSLFPMCENEKLKGNYIAFVVAYMMVTY